MRLRILLFSLLLIFLANSGWTEESADEWFKKGNEASEAGDHEEAVRCFERTIALDPGHLGGFRNIGCVYGMRGMWDEAIEPFIKALAINPNDAQIHYNLGFCWYKTGMFDEAIAEFEKAVALNPEFRDAYHNLGIVYGKKEMFSQAIPMFRKAVEIGPDNAETHFSLGKAYKEVGDDMLAADHYYKAGILYLQKGHREGALAAYENVVPYSKEIADVLFRRLYPDEEASDVTMPFFSQREVGGDIVRRPFSEEEISDSTSPLPLHQKAEVSEVTKPSTLDREEAVFEVAKPLPLDQKGKVSDLREPLPPDQGEEVSDVAKPLPSVKTDSWYVLLRRMNLRQSPSTSGKITHKLNKNAEFQIMEEAPDNNPRNSWYLIRSGSGFTGWLCGIYYGNVKYKELPQPDPLQKESAGDLARAPYSEEEISDVPKPLPLEPQEEISDVSKPLSSDQEEEVADLARQSPSEQEEEAIKVEKPLPLESQEEVSEVTEPLPQEQEEAASDVASQLPLDQEEEVADVAKPLPSVKADSWYVLLRRMNLRQDPSTSGKIIRKLHKNAEFQIMEEAPDNNPRNSWYLIRSGSGFTGWLCGIYYGNVKYKELPQPDPLQKESAGDLARAPYSEEEISDVPKPLPLEPQEEISDVSKPLLSEQEQEVSEVTEPLPSEQEQEVSHLTEPLPSDQEEEVADVAKPLPSVKAESWYVLLRRMNLRQDPSTSGKITHKLNKNAEFQIIEEAPDNNPRNSWYLIRSGSGFTGWLCGIYYGNVKYKELPQPDPLQKESAGDLARAPYSEEEISDVPKPLPLEPQEEISDVSKPLLSEQEQEVSEVTEPLPSEQEQEVSHLTEPLPSDQEEEVADVAKPLPSVKAESWYVLLRRMNLRQDPSTSGKITHKLNKNAEFQIIEEAPDNNPRNSWYLIRTRSGFTGWLCGIYYGNVKYKDLPQSDFLAPR